MANGNPAAAGACRLDRLAPERPPLGTVAETWIDARLELFSIRCIAVDGGLRWLAATQSAFAARARGATRRVTRRRWITP